MGCSNSTQNNVTPAQKPGAVGAPPKPVKQLTDQQVEEKKNLDASLSLSLPEAESELLGSAGSSKLAGSTLWTQKAGMNRLREEGLVTSKAKLANLFRPSETCV